VALGHAALDRAQLVVGFDPDARDDHRPLERAQSREQDVLVLAARQHEHYRPAPEVTEGRPRGGDVGGGRRRVDPLAVDAVGHHAEAAARMQAAPQRARDRRAHGDGTIGRDRHGDQRGRQREGHGVARDDEGMRQSPLPPQPRERAAVARGVAVRHVHARARHYVAERSGERTQATEVQGHELEPRVRRKPCEHRPGPTADQHAMPAPGELATQVRDRHGRAGPAALVRQLQDRERPGGHGSKLASRCARFHGVALRESPCGADRSRLLLSGVSEEGAR